MRFHSALLASLAAALPLAACGGATPISTMQSIAYGDPVKPYLGKSKAEIIACAGAPHSQYGGAGTETITYHYSGPGPRPGAEAKSDDTKKPGMFGGIKKQSSDWDCTASLVFENNRLIRVSFAHKEVDSPYAYQSKKDKEGNEAAPTELKTCTFVLPPSCGGRS
jgi:hypothetical protein